MAYRETAKTREMRKDVAAHNAVLSKVQITLSHPEACYDALGLVLTGGRRLNPERKTYIRVFNGTFIRGGRWYGPWWQSLPAGVRTGLRIDGEPTVEHDISGCHMRLLCARAGVAIGNGDPYALSDLPRNEIKVGVNIMLNATSWRSARGALVNQLADEHGPAACARADRIREELRLRFPAFEPYWNSGYGLKLQNIDAAICMQVQRRLRQHSVPCLSVHDSFLVPQLAEDLTVRTVEEEFDRACHRLGREGSK
jgi:hypothetical protein